MRIIDAVRSASLRRSCTIVLSVLLPLSTGCLDPYGGASDIPCITNSEWNDFNYFRKHGEDLLVTEQSEQDHIDDAADGQVDNIPHSTVYRFDSASQSLAVAPDEEWDDSEEQVELCCHLVLEVGRFVKDGTTLRYDGEPIEVAGGALVKMSPSPSQRFLAVLSTNGRILPFSVSTGQHFHQVFSVDTGERIGPELRLAIGGMGNGSVRFDWTADERFVVYFNSIDPNNDGGTRLCVVDRNRDLQ